MIKSKFKFSILLPVFIVVATTFLLYIIVSPLTTSSEYNTSIIIYALAIFLAFIWICFFCGELRTRAVIVAIDEKILLKKNYLGLGIAKVFDLSEFDGFETCSLPSRGGPHEYLHLIKDGKRLVTISEFYHKNYYQLKQCISKTVKFSGNKTFSILSEIKNVFSY